MRDTLTFSVALFQVFVLALTQRIAPGVPPQQYQQPPPPQYQQVPQQQQQQQQPYYQQPQVQQQQKVPVHQQPPQYQPQVPVQTAPPSGHHHPHAQHGQPQQILNAANLALEKDHIQEHLDVPIDTSKMSEQELQFHYFKMHDADNNNKLDGCELIKSLIHWHAENEGENAEIKIQKDSDLEAMIDPILKEMDSDNDGYVDYAEFKKAS